MNGYNPSITIGKGGKQLINVLSSAAVSSGLVILINGILGKEIEAETIQQGMNNISGSVLFLTPIVSAFIRMAMNYIKNRNKGK